MWLGIGSMFSLLPFLVFWSALQQQQDGTRYAYRPQTYTFNPYLDVILL